MFLPYKVRFCNTRGFVDAVTSVFEKEQTMIVKNLNGTSEKVPSGCSCWLDFWARKSGQKPSKCGNSLCGTTSDLVGAHVKKVEGYDDKHYIVPLCKKCNGIPSNQTFDVNQILVPAKQS